MGGELGLMSAVLEDGRFHLRQYGHLVSKALKENNKENICMACLFASNYWRIVGRPSEAIECQKKALHLAPNAWKFSSLLSMANVLHRTHHSEDAVTVLHKAIEITPDNPALHFTLGNIQATLLNFNESAESFRTALKFQPNFEAAKRRHHAVVCHQKIEHALEEQQNALQETLRELRHYKKQHDTWASLLNKIINEQASIETRLHTTIGYEHSKLRIKMAESETRRRSKLHQVGRSNMKWAVNDRGSCAQTVDEEGNLYLTCSVLPSNGGEDQQDSTFYDQSVTHGHEVLSKVTDENSLDDIDLLLKKFESRIEDINSGSESTEAENKNADSFVATTRDNKGASKSKSKVNTKSDLKDDYHIRPTLPQKYFEYPKTKRVWITGKGKNDIDQDSKDIIEDIKDARGPDWPTKDICNEHNLKREWNEYPTVFLSPENKGFE